MAVTGIPEQLPTPLVAAQPVRHFCLRTRGVLKRWNVRCRRSLVGNVVCQLDNGAVVAVRGVEVGGWLELADGRGWVLRQHPKHEGVGWVETTLDPEGPCITPGVQYSRGVMLEQQLTSS